MTCPACVSQSGTQQPGAQTKRSSPTRRASSARLFHAIPTTYVNGSTLGTAQRSAAQRRTDYCVSAAARNSVERERGGGIKLPATSSLSVLGQGTARQSAQLRGCVPRQQSPTSCISPGRVLTRRECAVEGQSCPGEWLAPRSFDFSESSLPPASATSLPARSSSSR